MFNIGCTYSRAFKYAVMLPQWGRVDLSSAALDMQDKIGKVGNTPFYFGWVGEADSLIYWSHKSVLAAVKYHVLSQ